MAAVFRERPLLTPLMCQLLAGVANGQEVKDMAAERYVSASSAYNTVNEAKLRLGARSLSRAVVVAMGKGFLSFPTGPDQMVFPLPD